MKAALYTKLNSSRGLARIIVILLVLVVILAIVCAIPGYLRYQRQGYTVACAVALDSAGNQLIEDFLLNDWESGSAEDAKELVAYAMNGWDDLCPEYGTVYIVNEEGTKDDPETCWQLVCGLHGADKKLCTRLNATNVRDQLREALRREHLLGNLYPETLSFSLHHRTYTARLVDAETGFRRGTALTRGYKGIVAFYSLAGHSDFGADSGLDDGELWYFSFADEDHCATWRSDDGWSGDSYQEIS